MNLAFSTPIGCYLILNGLFYRNLLFCIKLFIIVQTLNNIWDSCRLKNEGNSTEVQQKLSHTPISVLYKSIGVDLGMEYISVGLSASDEQLKNDFSKWLSEQRELVVAKPAKNNFTDSKMESWVKDRLLPYIDLVIIPEFI